MPDASVPAIGKVNKPTLIIAGLAGAGALIYAYVKKKKDAAAATPATTSAYGYGAYSYGYGAGSELAQEEALAAEGYGYGGYGYAASGFGVGTSVPVTSTIAPVATNAEWAQYAEQFLVNQGYTGTTVGEALGAYITGQNVGANESIVEAAIAFQGYPPVPGADNYPPNINTNGSNTGQGTGTTGGTGTTSTTSKAAGSVSNLVLSKKSGTSIAAKWNPATGATGGYKWALTGPVNKSGSTHGTSVTITGLKAGSYNFGIQALPGGQGNNEHVTI
jgi:hypothetical protein